MRFVLFYHSLVSDWNHGNAHFLRGIAAELLSRGHELRIYEPRGGWSLTHLRAESGEQAIERFHAAFPQLSSTPYDPDEPGLEQALEGADVVLVHEWNAPALVARIGALRGESRRFRLLFHDTHHRAVSAPEELAAYDLRYYDGVLAFGAVLRRHYLERGLAARAWTWHEAADVRRFHPVYGVPRSTDLVWVGNWGDGERSAEIGEFIIEPVRALGLAARIHGVRYPPEALRALAAAGITWEGWLANFDVPRAFAAALFTVHVPRRFYRERLPGIPTIRVFEALACGIPLVCAPWQDCEGLFRPGEDYLVARDGREMREHLRHLRWDPAFALTLAARGRRTVLERHTCAHRVDELLAICAGLATRPAAAQAAEPSRRPAGRLAGPLATGTPRAAQPGRVS